MASAQDDLGIITGIALFLVTFKVMKYTKKIPIMCIIHNTFADTVWRITIFLALMCLIFVAFAMMFMNMYSLKMAEFGTFRQSVLGMFQLMNGDLDVDALITQRPIAGPAIYIVYTIFTVFIAFTILISIVSDSYENAKDRQPDPGLVTLVAGEAQAYMKLKMQQDDDDDDDDDDEVVLDPSKAALHHSVALILKKLEHLEQPQRRKLKPLESAKGAPSQPKQLSAKEAFVQQNIKQQNADGVQSQANPLHTIGD